MNISGTFATHILDSGEILSNRYEIQEQIGSGGMATVYLARDTWRENQLIAVKILHKEFAEDKQYVERFLREVQVLQQVDHPNVVKTYDIRNDSKLIYFTMEFVPGATLEKLMEQKGFSSEEVASIVIQVCEGLQAIHEKEIIHRDLKPGNIMVQPDGSIKILDFGVAREKSSRLTTKNQKVGSIVYMAPEVWLGKEPTPAVDYYSLGVILYELTTGEVPFEHEYPGKIMAMHLEGSVVPPCNKNPKTPEWLNTLILRLLAKSPKDRPRTSAEIIQSVSPYQMRATLEVPSEHLTGGEAFSKPIRERKNTRRTYLFKLSATRLLREPDLTTTEKPPRRKATVVLNLPRHAAIIFEIEPPSRDFIYFGIFLASLQIFDGVLTSMGMQRFGIDTEGNPILRYLMNNFGVDQALMIMKFFAVLLVFFLTLVAKRLRWVKNLIGLLSCLYMVAAILPWVYLLYLDYQLR